jgi:alpha-tubulin suppressor-like RCC1 family protein
VTNTAQVQKGYKFISVLHFFSSGNGDVFVWGYGILGKGPIVNHAKEPTQIPPTLFGRNEFQSDSQIIAVSAGIGHLAAVSNHGDLYMWGHNRRGCLGLGSVEDQFFPLKVKVV